MEKSKYFAAIACILGIANITMGQQNKVNETQLKKVMHFSDSTGATKAMVLYNSEVIGSFNSTTCDSVYMNTASMVKSWTGIVVGILIDKGLVESENEEICNYVPEWKSGCKNGVTIKHLLTMSSGLLKIRPASSSILAEDDMNEFALRQKISKDPGTTFSYSNEGVQLLGILIEHVSGKRAGNFFQQHLFKPLDMDSTSLWKDKAGNDIVLGGTKTTIQDASKIGLLMLNKGKYKGKRIVSEKWVQKTISPSETADNYGYLWWLDPSNNNSPMDNYAAMGDLGQMTIIFPQMKLIYLRQQSCKHKDIPNLSWMGPDFLKMLGNIIEVDPDKNQK